MLTVNRGDPGWWWEILRNPIPLLVCSSSADMMRLILFQLNILELCFSVRSVLRAGGLVYEGPCEGSRSRTVTPGMCVSAGGRGLEGLVAEFSGSNKQRVVLVQQGGLNLSRHPTQQIYLNSYNS